MDNGERFWQCEYLSGNVALWQYGHRSWGMVVGHWSVGVAVSGSDQWSLILDILFLTNQLKFLTKYKVFKLTNKSILV